VVLDESMFQLHSELGGADLDDEQMRGLASSAVGELGLRPARYVAHDTTRSGTRSPSISGLPCATAAISTRMPPEPSATAWPMFATHSTARSFSRGRVWGRRGSTFTGGATQLLIRTSPAISSTSNSARAASPISLATP
jgi:hypothetical protein